MPIYVIVLRQQRKRHQMPNDERKMQSLQYHLAAGTVSRSSPQSDGNNDNGKTVGVSLSHWCRRYHRQCHRLPSPPPTTTITTSKCYISASVQKSTRTRIYVQIKTEKEKITKSREEKSVRPEPSRTKKQIHCNKNLVARVDSCRVSCSGEWKRKMATQSNG